ncbi:hypothetical protein [Caulifigura coniformis]|uniref:hypothetical protein n=1 Tax=Caulifigura coniformis TaxID=2527983 RepID=UPI0018D22D20|nr:hypothetical protein [Caulifigura coniformis]
MLTTARDQSTLAAEKASEAETWKRRIGQRLEFDIRNSRQVRIRPGRILFEGYAGRDAVRGNADHHACRVTWSLIDAAGRGLLVRKSEPTSPHTGNVASLELMVVGIRELLAGRPEDSLRELRIPVPAADEWHDYPSGLRILLVSPDQTVLVDQLCRGDRP